MIFLNVSSLLFWFLVGLLVLLLGIIVFLVFYIKKYVKQIGQDKSKVYSFFNENIEPGGTIFLGDSLTEFYRLDEFFPNLNVYNRGIAANTSIDVLNRLEDNVIKMKPKKVFLQIGTNDLGEKAKPIEVIDNIKTIISRIKNGVEDVKIFLISLYPVNSRVMLHSKFITGKRKNKVIDYINQELINYCQENNITFIDVASHLKDENGKLKKKYTLEGLHINSFGYLKITEILKDYVL